jgi:hypothetical protein
MAKTKLQTDLEQFENTLLSLGQTDKYSPLFAMGLMASADLAVKAAQAAKKKIQSLLKQHHHATTKHLFAIDGKDTGTVNQHFGPLHLLKIVIRKKVDWEQEHLKFLLNDPEVAPYIEAKYSVKEAEYDKAPIAIRDKLDGGRTVVPSDPVFSIEERK